MNRTLMLAIVEASAFLALSGDDVVDPDASVAQLEAIGAILQGLSPDERVALGEFLEGLAESERQKGVASERGDFLDSLMENLGLE